MTDVPGTLSARHRAVLDAVCETLLPAIERDDDPAGLFATGARAAKTTARVIEMVERLPDPSDRRRLERLLTALDSRIASAVLGGGFHRFTRLAPARREQVLVRWSRSAFPMQRAGFQALKRLVHVAYACWPLEDGSHPAWKASGYPGPLSQPAEQIDALPTLTIDGDTTLDCDVVVVGSGAGGGVVAGLLAEAGRDVIVLEKGGNPGSREMTQVEGDMVRSLFLDGGTLMTQSGSMPILAGSCLGGGTVINWTSSFALPHAVREEWSDRSGLGLFISKRFDESIDRVSARLNVGTEWTTPSVRDQILERGLRKLGWHVAPIPRNVTACREGLECGYCGYGCRHGAKNSTTKTYLASAARLGARMIIGCDARRVLVSTGRATGVEALVMADGRRHRLTVRANTVVAACGAIHTPALLIRSGLTNKAIGRNLHLHPVTAVAGLFPERVEPWSGSLQTRYSEEFAYLDGPYGFRCETGPVHYALPASAFGWGGAAAWRTDIARLAHTSVCGILTRDRDAGRVHVSRDGRPRVVYDVSRHDATHMREGVWTAAQVLAAAGATELFTLQTPPTRIKTDRDGWLDRFMATADRAGYAKFHMSGISFHQMASAAMGLDPGNSVIGETGEAHEVKGLYVADGSAFVTSSGVNPMLTIMAIADHVARRMIE
ncbi:MAG TPA: FAD-dependent oxidoreductase [Gemmatimonadales bacterium]